MQATIRAVPGRTLSQFVSEHAVGLTRFAFLLCGDRGQAEDLVQDAFLSLYRRFGEHLTIAAPVAYARRSIVNAHISRGRLKSSRLTVVGDPPDHPDPGADPAFTVEQSAMWSVLATLPDRHRAVLVLRYYLDQTDAEIAHTLDCREGTVRSLASRAFTSLRGNAELAATTRPEEDR